MSPWAQLTRPALLYLDGLILLVESFWVRERLSSTLQERQGVAKRLARADGYVKPRTKPRSPDFLGGLLQVAVPPWRSEIFSKGLGLAGDPSSFHNEQLCANFQNSFLR